MAGLSAIILAAGAGTRMKSRLSKVLHPLAGRPLLHYSVLAAQAAGAEHVVVVASPDNREAVAACLKTLPFATHVVVQERPLGTGHAARAAVQDASVASLLSSGQVLILCGDTPLLEGQDLAHLLSSTAQAKAQLGVLTCHLADATGYGRILRTAAGDVQAIREQKDLETDAQRALTEVNAGVYCIVGELLQQALAGLSTNNAAGEYYLTDIVQHVAARGRVHGAVGNAAGLQGVNDRAQLARLEQVLFERIAERHRMQGVTIQHQVQIDAQVRIGRDCVLRAGAVLRGETQLAEGVVVDHGCVIEDSTIEADAHIKPHSVIVKSRVGERCQVGPFAHLRPESVLENEVHVGNFVETKKTLLRQGAKANHLAYLGDGDVGEGANIGAGTIFCNYDGFSKWRTTIGKGAFIGSDSQLIAPINVGAGAYVGTGTTLTADVPDGALALSRPEQVIKPGYAQRLRDKLSARKPA